MQKELSLGAAPSTAVRLTKAHAATLQILIHRAFGTCRSPTSLAKIKAAARAKSPAHEYPTIIK